MPTTNNFSSKTPRQNNAAASAGRLLLGPFQPDLEAGLAREIAGHKRERGALAPLWVIVPTRLLGLHLRRALAPRLPAQDGRCHGHINVRFLTLTDLAEELTAAAPLRRAPRLGLELLCDRIAREVIAANGYFAPVRDTKGFRLALLETFKDLKQAGIGAAKFKAAANTAKLRQLAAAYEAFCDWLEKHGWHDEADLLSAAAGLAPKAGLPPMFLYGFYDLTVVQRQFVERLSPEAVFFPWPHTHCQYAQPLRDWLEARGYKSSASASKQTSAQTRIVSAPGEAVEVREALREALAFVREQGRSFNDVAILCRSLEQYDAILRDTLATLGVKAYFRGGRPLAEHSDAKLLLLLLEAIRSDFSRSTVMELACHIGPNAHWDALSLKLGIVGGQQQWLSRLKAATEFDESEERSSPGFVKLRRWLERLFADCEAVPQNGGWREFAEAVLAAFGKLGGRHPAVREAVGALAELDAFASPVSLDVFADACQKALEQTLEQTGRFQDGGIFVGDVMSARGLSWPMVLVLGLVEKNFPRLIREDPLLLDEERARLGLGLPQKGRGQQEEHLLFALAAASATERLVLSYPRLEPISARPRVPSFLLLERTGATTAKALQAMSRVVPMSRVATVDDPIEEREIDLAALQTGADADYMREISALLADGVQAQRRRWRDRALTGHDGLIESPAARMLLRERFGPDAVVLGATSLEDFFCCPFYYFQKHILRCEPWEEPEAAIAIDPLDLGSLYHEILEEYFCRAGQADLRAVVEEKFQQFEQLGVTGYPTVWEIKKEIICEELAAFIARDARESAGRWAPARFEEKFNDLCVGPPVRLRGKIDRIDLSPDGARARVLDYKTGRLPRRQRDNSLAGGEALQLPVYLLAAERLLPATTVEAASYLYLTLRGQYRTISFSREALRQRRAELDRVLQTAAEMIRDGIFAQHATEEGCRSCEFRPICGNGILKLYPRKRDDPRMAAFRQIKEEVS